jgi:hypothetical protein
MRIERGWAHRTPSLCALSSTFAVCTDDAWLGRRVDEVLGGLRGSLATAPVDHCYALTAADPPAPPGMVDVARDGEELARGLPWGDAVGWVVWDVNRAAAEAGGDHLLFHAGAIEADGVGVLLPGASGSGKSTLVAGLVRHGLGYLTDELVAVHMGNGQLLPYPKPITVKPGSFGVLGDMDPDVSSLSGQPLWAGQEWQVAVGDGVGRRIGAASVPGFVVLPHYDAGAETVLTPLSETEAFFALALHAVNLLPHGSDGTRTLGQLATECRCFSLTMSDLDEACRLLLAVVSAPTTGVPAVLGGGECAS